MSNLESLALIFEKLGVTYSAVSHSETESFHEWAQIMNSTNPNIAITKTFVLKSSKGEKTDPFLILALDSTPFSISSLSKGLGAKDARMAQDDLIKTLFGVGKLDGNFCRID